MRTRLVKLCGWLAIGGSLAFSARADNNCIENPTTSQLTLLQPGTLAPGYVLTPTSISVCVGQLITPPTVTNLAMTNGLEKYYVTYVCKASGWQTSSISYTLTNYFVPQIPTNNCVTGTYYYTGIVVASSSFSPITNILGMITINVTEPPVIVSQPSSQTVIQGSNVIFTVGVSANSTAPLNYQWQKNGVNLTNSSSVSGVNSSTLTLTGVRFSDAGLYSVAVSNALGSVTSYYAVLRVWTRVPPGITAWDPPGVIAWGDNLYGECMPTGLTNVVAIAGGGGHSLALKADGTVAAWGWDYSDSTNVPVGLTNAVAIAEGELHNLALQADGTVVAWGYNGESQINVPFGLTNVVAIAAGWFHNLVLKNDGTVVAWGYGQKGETNVPAGLTNVAAIAAGDGYSLALKNDGTLVAWGQPWTGVPSDLTNVVAIAGGSDHSLALKGDGTVVAWGYNHNGQTNVPAGLTNVVAIAAGEYHSLALRSDGTVVAWGYNVDGETNVPSGLTNVVAIAAGDFHNLALGNAPPSIITQPQSQTVPVGNDATFSVVASGAPLYYQWYFNGTALTGITASTITLPNVQMVNAGTYWVVVSNALGSVTSSNAILTVTLEPPVITEQPASQITYQGDNPTFNVTASGTMPFSYQWYFNETNIIAGATGSSLTLANVQINQTGTYSVVVTNIVGSTMSSDADLTVTAILITTQPTNQTVPQSSDATFSVTALSSLPLSYQWRFNGADIADATNAVLIIHDVESGKVGAYSVSITNDYGSIASDDALLNMTYYSVLTIAGSSTFSSIAYDRLAALFDAGYGCISNSANIVSFQGTMSAQVPSLGSNVVMVCCSFSNSASGITAIEYGYPHVPTAQTPGTYTNRMADLAFSDVFPDVTTYECSTLGVIPYVLVRNNALTGVTNFTRSQRQLLIYYTGKSGMPASYLGANSSAIVYLIGYYNSDMLMTVRACLGDLNASDTYGPTLWTTNGAGQFIQSSHLSAGPSASGIVQGNSNALAFTPASDYQSAVPNVTAVAYNGVPYSTANVTNGSYTLWGYGQIFNKTGLTAGKQAMRDALVNAITSAAYASSPLFSTNGLVPLANMHVDRLGEGQLIVPHNF